jgi:hypothetical protein
MSDRSACAREMTGPICPIWNEESLGELSGKCLGKKKKEFSQASMDRPPGRWL